MSALEPSTQDPWQVLRALTDARIALGRAGSSVPTVPQLDFQWAHARARDAVHHPLDLGSMKAALESLSPDVCIVRSAAKDRPTYLQRPDLGRRLDSESRSLLESRASKTMVSPDSMGIYLSWQPKVGLHDSARNCLSNIRPQGMSDVVAVEKFMYLLCEGMRRQLTGVALKDETIQLGAMGVQHTQQLIL